MPKFSLFDKGCDLIMFAWSPNKDHLRPITLNQLIGKLHIAFRNPPFCRSPARRINRNHQHIRSKLLLDKKDYRSLGFDVLMANPPFAGDIKQTDMLASYELARKANGRLENKVGRDLLFIE